MWTKPAWIKIGVMNRHHWFGAGPVKEPPITGFGTPPIPQRSDRVHVFGKDGLTVVVFGQNQSIWTLAFCTFAMLCMQG